MRSEKTKVVVALLLAFALGGIDSIRAQEDQHLPNILFILADDLGYAELDCFGSEDIRTPVLETLADMSPATLRSVTPALMSR